jgi:hypothetical protein
MTESLIAADWPALSLSNVFHPSHGAVYEHLAHYVPHLANFEDRTAQPEDCDKYNVSKDMEDAMCVAMDEQVSARDQTRDPSSEQFTVIWHSNFVNASYPIDGDVSCAAHFRCYLPLAAGSQNTEQAAKL